MDETLVELLAHFLVYFAATFLAVGVVVPLLARWLFPPEPYVRRYKWPEVQAPKAPYPDHLAERVSDYFLPGGVSAWPLPDPDIVARARERNRVERTHP